MEELLFSGSSFSGEEVKLSNALRRRLIYLVEEVNESSMFEVIYLLDRIICLDKRLGTKEPITIRLRTNGGSIYHGLALIGKILEMKTNGYKIVCESEGMVISMGVPIMVSCSVRRAHKYDTFLIHNASAGIQGDIQTIDNYMKETRRLNDTTTQIIIDNSLLNKKLINRKTAGLDWHISAKEALDLGLIDEII